MEHIKTRPDVPVGARYVGDAGHHDIHLRVYVRSAMGKDLPDQQQVEDRVSELLLAMPRLDEGADWDVSATMLPSD